MTLGTTEATAQFQALTPYNAFVVGPVPTNKETYVDGTLDIYNDRDVLVYSHTPRFRGRGNTTWGAPKKPYKVRSLDRLQTPFGFAPSRDWALMADYFDESYLRTTIAFEIARRATRRWAPNSRPMRLTWNGVYQGLYRYSETADVQVGRVDIREMDEEDVSGNALTGPYYVETDDNYDSPGFRTSRNTPVMWDTPDGTVTAQASYMQSWTETFETALVQGAEAEILAGMDLPSWCDWYLLQEVCRQEDATWKKSCKWIKDQDAPNGTGKSVLWPPWDFDLSLGEWFSGAPSSASGWHVRNGSTFGSPGHPNWLYYAWTRSATFRNAVEEAWFERFVPVLNGIGEFIHQEGARIEPLIEEDREKWFSGSEREAMDHYEWIGDWLSTRTNWITANL